MKELMTAPAEQNPCRPQLQRNGVQEEVFCYTAVLLFTVSAARRSHGGVLFHCYLEEGADQRGVQVCILTNTDTFLS